MNSVCLIQIIFLFSFIVCAKSSFDGDRFDIQKVKHIVKQWSPLIWLHPNEKFMPSDVEEFLENINLADETGNILSHSTNHSGRFLNNINSNKAYLIPKISLDKLQANSSSFLYGKNPKYSNVPIYAVINQCNFFLLNNKNHRFNRKSPSQSFPYFHVTYWMFYPYNEGKDVCFLGKVPSLVIFNKCLLGRYRKLGNHIGDWEHMSLYFAGKPYPEKLFLAVHDSGAYYSYNVHNNVFKYESQVLRKGIAQVPKFPAYIRLQGGHPVVFAAQGSHGLWSNSGIHQFIRVPKIYDNTDYGIPWKTWYSIKFHHVGITPTMPWMEFKGKWGNPKEKCILLKKLGVCEYTEGPRGLLRENQDFYC